MDPIKIERSAYLHKTAVVLCTVAKHWVGAPDDVLRRLQTLRDNLRPDADPFEMNAKNRSMLRHFMDHALADRMLQLPHKIYCEYDFRKTLSKRDARRLELAMIVEMQLIAAMRPRNTAALRIDLNLLRRGSLWHLFVPAEDVKNKVTIEMVLPAPTAILIEKYLSHVRPVLLGTNTSDYVFPGRNGGHRNFTNFGAWVGDFVEREVGVRVTAHRFRHLAGFLYLEANPNGYEVVRLLLGHRRIDTTIRFYAGMEARAAHKRYDDFIARRRSNVEGRDNRRAVNG